MSDFEKLGVFYLGKKYDIQSRRTLDDLVLYDSRDMVTHAVCIGMTGSGKTGLCLGLLEEAAIDGIPVIAIDPKGDIGNLLLTFPDLAPSDFAPWVDAAEARRQGKSTEALAAEEATRWTEGLKAWGEDGARIKRLRDACQVNIYTPGASSGIPVSILHSLACPGEAVLSEPDLLRERVANAAACILALLGITFDPLKSREHILLSSIIGDAWKNNHDVGLTDLISLIQKPPLSRVGALDLETFYPAKERVELSLAINNLLASPGFDAWLTGEGLDIDSLLYSPEGKPRISIFSISHLGDGERMFFVTLLLNAIVGWMRLQSGTTSLRAMVYMDEIFGYFPPVSNPPAKQPLLTLLKQARAFGLGVVLATQNPVDIDYKGLSNAGTWFIGRLQTERDKLRVLDGLESASLEAGGGHFDRGAMSETLSSLGQRVFLMNNVHEDAPVIFQTRWTLSYLRGPLARGEIKRLMEPARAGANNKETLQANVKTNTGQEIQSAPTVPKSVASAGGGRAPVIDPSIKQLFIPPSVAAFSGSPLNVFEPTLFAGATVRFSGTKGGQTIETVQEKNYLVPVSTSGPIAIDFARAKTIKIKLSDIPQAPLAGADGGQVTYLEPHADLVRAAAYKNYSRDFAAYLSANCKLVLLRSPSTGLFSAPGETERDFRIRLSLSASEKRDAAVAKLREKYQGRLNGLTEKIRLADNKIEQEEAQARQADLDSAISVGATVLGAFMGRKMIGSSTVGRATTAARGVNRASKQRQDVALAKGNRADLETRLAEVEREFEQEREGLTSRFNSQTEVLEETVILPKKSDITVNLVGLAWVKG